MLWRRRLKGRHFQIRRKPVQFMATRVQQLRGGLQDISNARRTLRTEKPMARTPVVRKPNPASLLLTSTHTLRIMLTSGGLGVSLAGALPTTRSGLFVDKVDPLGPSFGQIHVRDQIVAVCSSNNICSSFSSSFRKFIIFQQTEAEYY